MSRIRVRFENNSLFIEKLNYKKQVESVEQIYLEEMKYGAEYKSQIKASHPDDQNKLLYFQEIDYVESDRLNESLQGKIEMGQLSEESIQEIAQKFDNKEDLEEQEDNENTDTLDEVLSKKRTIIVYSEKNKISYSYCSLEKAYKKIIQLKFKVLNIKMKDKYLEIRTLAFIINKFKVNIEECNFYIDNKLHKQCRLKEYHSKIKKYRMIKEGNIYKFRFNMSDIINDESTINGSIRFEFTINGVNIPYKIGIKDKKIKNKRYYYSPMKSIYVKDYAIHIRRTTKGNLVLVKRLKEPIENTTKFKFFESKLISGLLYRTSKLNLKLRRKPINLFYEKFSSKAEEGAYDLFVKARDNSKKSNNYFIIDEQSNDYDRIKNEINVVKKYSAKYYWLVFNANNFISTEAPIHLNILRSNNKALRRSQCDKPFIFLQHGITYLKCQGDGSTFAKDKEGQATYIVVGSEKEKDAVVDMLNMKQEQVLNTGLPIFSKIEYKHINNDSEDIITIMLTWKPYEEQLYNFEESTYYKNTVDIFEMLKKYIPSEKIVIIPHPKVYDLLANTDMKDSIWLGKISEVLAKTKLLITDYSSVCYNSFYQGAGVVFYQPDLIKYEQENGLLIPNDDEYIGYRAFDMNQLEEIIDYCIKNNRINLNVIRNDEFEKRYLTINEYTDGKNIDRIYEKLKELEII